MEYKFASRMERMKASEIRELLKLTARPDIISFAGGLPAPELFPVKEIARVAQDLMERKARSCYSMLPPKAVPPCGKRSQNA